MIYPVDYGFKVSVEIIRESDTARVKVLCPMYMSKEFIMKHSYSLDYSDHDILNDSDFIRVMFEHFPHI